MAAMKIMKQVTLQTHDISVPVSIDAPLARKTSTPVDKEESLFEEILQSPSYSRQTRYHAPLGLVLAPSSGSHRYAGKEEKYSSDDIPKKSGHTSYKTRSLSLSSNLSATISAAVITPPTVVLSHTLSTSPAAMCSAKSATTAHASVIAVPTPLSLPRQLLGGGIAGVPSHIHPSIARIGRQYAHYKIMGSNARCKEMMLAFIDVIDNYKTPPHVVLNRHLDSHLKPQISFLVSCRPLATSMGNAIRYLKCQIANLPPDIPEEEAKGSIRQDIVNFIHERMVVADQLIADHLTCKIQDGDVILIYARSDVVISSLVSAYKQGKRFRVVVVDSRPWLEGLISCRHLKGAAIPITYIFINAIGYIMDQVTKIILGAHCVYSNGTVQSRAGTCLVAMTAYNYKVPVIVCCEMYKFSDRVQLESSYSCEYATMDPVELLKAPVDLPHFQAFAEHCLGQSNPPTGGVATTKNARGSSGAGGANVMPSASSQARPTAHVSCVMYDITPAKLISMIISEIGMIPCTSVPVVIREYRSFHTTS